MARHWHLRWSLSILCGRHQYNGHGIVDRRHACRDALVVQAGMNIRWRHLYTYSQPLHVHRWWYWCRSSTWVRRSWSMVHQIESSSFFCRFCCRASRPDVEVQIFLLLEIFYLHQSPSVLSITLDGVHIPLHVHSGGPLSVFGTVLVHLPLYILSGIFAVGRWSSVIVGWSLSTFYQPDPQWSIGRWRWYFCTLYTTNGDDGVAWWLVVGRRQWSLSLSLSIRSLPVQPVILHLLLLLLHHCRRSDGTVEYMSMPVEYIFVHLFVHVFCVLCSVFSILFLFLWPVVVHLLPFCMYSMWRMWRPGRFFRRSMAALFTYRFDLFARSFAHFCSMRASWSWSFSFLSWPAVVHWSVHHHRDHRGGHLYLRTWMYISSILVVAFWSSGARRPGQLVLTATAVHATGRAGALASWYTCWYTGYDRC